MKRIGLCVLGVAAMLAVGSSSARANLIVNGGFETPGAPSGGYTSYSGGSNIGGWDVLGSDVLVINTTYGEPFNHVSPFNAQEGSNSLDITGAGNTSPNNGVEQSVATIAGQLYRLSFYVGRAQNSSTPPSTYNTPSTILLSIDGGLATSYTNSNITSGQVNWEQFSLTFTASSASTLVTFLNGTSPLPEGNNFAGLDNVSLNAVPEPASICSLALGGIGVALLQVARRRRRAAV